MYEPKESGYLSLGRYMRLKMRDSLYTDRFTNIEYELINVLNETQGLFQRKISPINLLNVDSHNNHPVVIKFDDLIITENSKQVRSS